MKKDIHPKNYRPVLFVDNSNGAQFIISSVVDSKETGKGPDGKEYPVFHVEISSASHPFYTGNEKLLDAAGRVEKFKTRSGKTTAEKPKTASAKKASTSAKKAK